MAGMDPVNQGKGDMKPRSSEPVVLALDAAGLVCSVAVAIGERVLGVERMERIHGQAEVLLPMVEAAMRKAALPPSALDLVGTTVGPGSFTGVRVGLAAARGIAFSTGALLIGVTGFEAVAAGLARSGDDLRARFLLIALESRREELYIQLFDLAGGSLGEPAAVLPIALGEVVERAIGEAPLLVAGDAAHRAALALSRHLRTTVIEDSASDAVGLARVALHQWRRSGRGNQPRPLYLHAPEVTLWSGRPRASR